MKLRIVLATALSIVMLVAAAALGGMGYAKPGKPGKPGKGSASSSQYQYQAHKVTICHKGKVTITIAKAAWPAHQRHGDTIGPCK